MSNSNGNIPNKCNEREDDSGGGAPDKGFYIPSFPQEEKSQSKQPKNKNFKIVFVIKSFTITFYSFPFPYFLAQNIFLYQIL